MTDPSASSDADPRWVGGRYVLQGVLGRGGMATVHRAHDEILDRTVAIKVLHPHLAHDATFLDRFRREARAAAGLSHPNVVTVHDWGETDHGAYLVLQLVEGLSLRQVLRTRGQLEPQEAAAVLGPVAAGLGAAHRAGLVHRDVKPENLLIGHDGTVRVTDFGLARAAASATSTFGADVLVGSPHYLSPEAVRGEPLDPRADVYALGVVLFECLTGRPPHEGESPYATAVAHTSRAVPAPSTLRPQLSSAVDDLVTRATSRDPAQRYDDATAFGRALATAIPDSAGVVAPPGVGGPRRPLDEAAGEAEAPIGGWTAILPPEEEEEDGGAEHAGGALPPPPPTWSAPGPPSPPRTSTDAVSGAADQHEDLDGWEGGYGPDEVDDQDGADDATLWLDRDEQAVPTAAGRSRRRAGRGWLALLVLLVLVGGSAVGGYLLWDRVLAPITPIPSVAGTEQTAATEQLRDAGFQVRVAADRRHDATTPPGHVLEQDPAGTARLGHTVTVVLSAGPRQVEVPDLRGEPGEDALATLRREGFDPTLVETHDPEVAVGDVVGLDPPAGASVDEGSEVEVRVSLGTQPLEVPELQGTRVEEAVAELESLGLEVELERRGGFRALLNPGRVYDQDPAPGTTVTAGDTVVVFGYE